MDAGALLLAAGRAVPAAVHVRGRDDGLAQHHGRAVRLCVEARPLNAHYARRHAYNFSFHVPLGAPAGAGRGGGREGAAAGGSLLARARTSAGARSLCSSGSSRRASGAPCHWFFFLDSDAYVAEQHVSVLRLLAGLEGGDGAADGRRSARPAAHRRRGRRRRGARARACAARRSTSRSRARGVRQGPPPAPAAAQHGRDAAARASAWTVALLRAWREAAEKPPCAAWFDARPFEQRCLEELLAAAPVGRRARARRARAPMQLFNSPWGEFAPHIWGGHGKEMAARGDEALRTHGVLGRARAPRACRASPSAPARRSCARHPR